MSRGDGVTRWCGEEDASWSSHIDFEDRFGRICCWCGSEVRKRELIQDFSFA